MRLKKTLLGNKVEEVLLQAYPHRLGPLQRHPLLFTCLYSVITPIVHVVLTLTFGGFSGKPNTLNLTEDVFYVPIMIILTMSIYYYLRFPRLVANAFDVLAANSVFVAETFTVSEKTKISFSKRLVFWFPYMFSSAGALIAVSWLLFFTPSSEKNWQILHPAITIFTMGSYIVAWIAIGGLLINVSLVTRLIGQVFRDNVIRVNPLHPDRSGGLGSLGKYSLQMSYLALSFGIALAAIGISSVVKGEIQKDYLLWFLLVVYVVIVPALFFLPLRSVHEAMKSFRDKLILETSLRYVEIHRQAHYKEIEEAREFEEALKYIEAIQKLEKIEQTYPVWPFRIRVPIGVLLNSVFPLILTIAGILVDATK